ncbi:MAG: hypothetical protein NTZ04_02275 [Chloroflexi bacterium]|nr:hypothetical protein [Chloroflexota bacterium]
MAGNTLQSFEEVAQGLSQKYGVPYEVVEAMLHDWMNTLYLSVTGREAYVPMSTGTGQF